MCQFGKTILAGAFVTVILSGCGGGGSAGGSIRSDIATISQSANSLLASNAFLLIHGLQFRGGSPCQAISCTKAWEGSTLLELLFEDVDDDAIQPGDIQLQRLADQQGVPMFEGEGRIEEQGITADVTALGGWLEHSYFGVEIAQEINFSFEGSDPPLAGLSSAGYAYSIGNATGTNPVSGSATWLGAVVGSDLRNQIQGDATLTFDFATMDMDVALTNLKDIDTGMLGSDMTWNNLPVTNGGFAAESNENSIEGRFYGPNHEEVGGIFERQTIVGAFGAKRQ